MIRDMPPFRPLFFFLFVSTFPVIQPKRWFMLLFSQNSTIVIPCLYVHLRIWLINFRRCRMLPPGLLVEAIGNITSLLFSVPFRGFQYMCGVQYKTSSPCHCSICEGGPGYLSELVYKYTPSRQLRSSSDSFTLRVPTTNRKSFGERSSPSLTPQSGTVSPLTFAPEMLLLYWNRVVKHIFFEELLRIQLNQATALFTFSSLCIVHIVITCNSIIHLFPFVSIVSHCKALWAPLLEERALKKSSLLL